MGIDEFSGDPVATGSDIQITLQLIARKCDNWCFWEVFVNPARLICRRVHGGVWDKYNQKLYSRLSYKQS